MKTIVLIDTNKDDLQFIKEAVASIDSEIQCLSFVFQEEAVEALISGVVQKPSIIFMNLNMRGKKGVQCLSELRSDGGFEDVPVALYAPKITSDVIGSLRDLGATMTFERPDTLRGWKTLVHEVLISIPGNSFSTETLFVNPTRFVSSF
ncbi:hypothetical protein [Chryseolinea sp. H1M3-3]|uniref:hypothetical protein n=1 Tax=Chryseolinea sp. H1M3-3 TaxID=3034144 RepID=UPI0023ED8CDE|nr:hypothetical protein [Chryseolinea sp. H1M3-3]